MDSLRHASSRSFLVAVALCCSLSGCGIVRYQKMAISVCDERTQMPVSKASVSAQYFQEMFKWNCGKVPPIQSGYTDEHGDWHVTLPRKRGVIVFVNSLGYERKDITLDKDTFRDGKLEVELTPCTEEATPGTAQAETSQSALSAP